MRTEKQIEHLRRIFTGRKLSEETKQKISVTSIKNLENPEILEKRIEALKIAVEKRTGAKLTEEHKKKLSEAHKGIVMKKEKSRFLDVEKVREIKKLLKEGKKQKEIGEIFGVSYKAIGKIKSGETWNHVKLEE